MQKRSSQTLTWTQLLAALRACTGEFVRIRDGNQTAPAAGIGNRPAAKGTELCLFEGPDAHSRLDLVAQLERLSTTTGRRFMTSARAKANDSVLLVESVADESIDGVLSAVVRTRRPKLAFNQSQQTGSTTTLRSKRIKTG